MKLLNYLMIIILMFGTITSCDYLDVVPDERPTEKDAFKDERAADRYLYSCYSFLPDPRRGDASLDFLTGDEAITAFEHETFAKFPKGNYTATTPVISYWNTLFSGIRQCYIFENNVGTVPGLPEDLYKDYLGQAKFLIAYYHYLLVRCYGPTIIIDSEPDINTPIEDYKARTPYDECIDFIVKKFDESIKYLPATRTGEDYGLATSVAAKAIKARLLLYAASPLFNGNTSYSDFKNNDGTPLMPTTYDPMKWQKAKVAAEEAITFAEQNGHGLYENVEYGENGYPDNPAVRKLRYNIMEPANGDILWADTRNESYYGLQNKSRPMSPGGSWNGVGVTMQMCDRFYTENGLPIDEDPEYSYNTRYDVVTVDEADKEFACPGKQTLKYNLNREPRFYAWVAFEGGYYEIMSASSNGAYKDDNDFQVNEEGGKVSSRLVTSMQKDGNCGRGNRTNNYTPSGFLNKKGCHPDVKTNKGGTSPITYPWPVIRLTELYLILAEASVEVEDLSTAKTYLNKVRQHAGIPTVEDSWTGVATLDQNKLREIVRQERQIEFYLENQNFWDVRRWLLGEQLFNHKHVGFNIGANNINDFAEETEIPFQRVFKESNYLLPIPIVDINNNTKLVQNPGY